MARGQSGSRLATSIQQQTLDDNELLELTAYTNLRVIDYPLQPQCTRCGPAHVC